MVGHFLVVLVDLAEALEPEGEVHLPGLGGPCVEGVLQNLLGDQLSLHHEVVEQVGVGHLVGPQVDECVVDLHIGPVLVGVADKSLQLQLDPQVVELLDLLGHLGHFLVKGELVTNADCPRLGIYAALDLLLFDLFGDELQGTHEVLGDALVEAVLEVLEGLCLPTGVDKVPDETNQVLAELVPSYLGPLLKLVDLHGAALT